MSAGNLIFFLIANAAVKAANIICLKALMTYHKKGLKPQSPGVFHWVLKSKKKERNKRRNKEKKKKREGGTG